MMYYPNVKLNFIKETEPLTQLQGLSIKQGHKIKKYSITYILMRLLGD